jgi:hypothetical protein
LSGKAEGAMIAPDHRFAVARRMLFKEIVARCIKDANSMGIDIICGLTGTPRDFIASGFTHIGPIYCLCKDYDFRHLLSGRLKSLATLNRKQVFLDFGLQSKLQRLKYHIASITKPTIDRPVQRMSTSFPGRFGNTFVNHDNNAITLARDDAFLSWRFAQNPFIRPAILIDEVDSTPRGYIVLSVSKKGKVRTGYIIDLKVASGCPESVLNLLWHKADRYFKFNAVSSVICYLSKCHADKQIQDFLVLQGVAKQVHALELIALWDHQKLDSDYISNLSNWSLSLAFTEGRRG